jgi:hypothetical protein
VSGIGGFCIQNWQYAPAAAAEQRQRKHTQ